MLVVFIRTRLKKTQRSDALLSERLVSLGIIGTNLKPPETYHISQQYHIKGGPQLLPYYAPGDTSLSDSQYKVLQSGIPKKKKVLKKNKIYVNLPVAISK